MWMEKYWFHRMERMTAGNRGTEKGTNKEEKCLVTKKDKR